MPSNHIYTLSLHDALPIFAGLHGLVNGPHYVGYAASKAGLMGMTRELAASWGRQNIRVNAIAPGFFHSRLADSAIPLAEPGIKDRKSTRLNSSHSQISYAVQPHLHSFPTRRSSDLCRIARVGQRSSLRGIRR